MYRHTQIGWVTILSLGVAFLFILFLNLSPCSTIGIFPAIVMFIIMLAFLTLTVTVKKDYINMVFGIGIFRMRIKTNEIVSSVIVRNRWWYGFGIHGWWGKGWLVNVSGLDAVELKMKNGMVYRVGSDEPQKLNEAIQAEIKQA